MIDHNPIARDRPMDPVAIVGLSALFPEADDLRAYWQNIVAGRDCVGEVPPSRWQVEDHYDPDPSAPDRTYCRRGGFVPELDFDPLEWGLPPNSLELTDVAQLLSLVLAKQAFTDGGYGDGGRDFDRERTGVVLGVGGGQKLITPLTSRLQEPVWRRALASSGVDGPVADLVVEKIQAAYIGWEEDSFPGLLGNVIAGRIASRFDLGGINCVVDAACAASLAAVRMALGELTEHRADLMLTGGVDADNSPFMYLCFSKTPAFSRANEIRPFDAASDGMLVGEGLGMLLLKRLADAERDGDRVYAVIRGLGASSDGRSKSIYAPRSEGQERALRRAYGAAGVRPSSVGLVEAHGTGTAAGDLCEAETLHRVLEDDGAAVATVALGSVKSQIGHTKAAAGAAGLIKAALALHHKVLPPTINVDRPNPALGLDGSPLYVNVEARPWLTGAPRRAGVSAFGFGGTNFHVVLEEHEQEHEGAYRLHGAVREVLVSAPSPHELAARCTELAAGMSDETALDRLSAHVPDDVPEEAPRVGFVAGDADECATLLRLAAERLGTDRDEEAWRLAQGVHYRSRTRAAGDRVAALFPGQGSQYVGMGRALALAFPPVRTRIAAADVAHVLYPPPAFDDEERAAQEERLRATALAQPAIGALSSAMFGLLRGAGFTPDFAAGHSFGELTALWAAGVLDDDDLLRLAHARGRAMTVAPGVDAGAMLAVTGERETVLAAVAELDGVAVANLNAPDQTVLAGPSDAVAEAKRVLDVRGLRTSPLPVAAAFHTPLVEHAQAPFAEAIRSCALRAPRLPVLANATAAPYPDDADGIAALLAEQLVRPVRWAEQVEALYADGARVFVEVGPGTVLTGLVRRTLGDRPHVALALDAGRGRDADRQLRDGVVQLRVLGLRLGELDPYRRLPVAPEAPPSGRLTVRLNGANYVSERTRAAYAAALARDLPAQPDKEPTHVSSNGNHSAGVPLLRSGDAVLAELNAQQRELVKLQQQLVAGQLELARAMLGGSAQVAVLDAIQRQQAALLHQHEAFVAQQTRYAETLLALLDGRTAARAVEAAPAAVAPGALEPAAPAVAPAPVVSAPLPPLPEPAPETPAGATLAKLQSAMLEVVSEKTGYPVATLELDMDIEADLGVDSIKRVEILGAMQARFPDLPEVRLDELAALRTLQEVVAYLERQEAQAEEEVTVSILQPRALPLPDELVATPSAGGCTAVTDDGTELTTALAHELVAGGRPTVVIRFPGSLVAGRSSLPPGAAEVVLQRIDEDAIEQTLSGIAAQHGAIGTFVHLHPRGAVGGLVEPAQAEVVRTLFLVAGRLRAGLEDAARAGRGAFLVVTRLDGALGTGADDSDPAGGGLYALAKTIRREWPGVFCRAVDLAPDLDTEAAVRAVLGELADPDERLVEVAHDANGRLTLVAEDAVALGG